MERFSKIFTGDRNLDQVQANVDKAIRQVTDTGIVPGIKVKDVFLATGSPVDVPHGLGRDPDWIVIKKNADARVWDSQSTNPAKRNTLQLNSSADVTVSLWIF